MPEDKDIKKTGKKGAKTSKEVEDYIQKYFYKPSNKFYSVETSTPIKQKRKTIEELDYEAREAAIALNNIQKKQVELEQNLKKVKDAADEIVDMKNRLFEVIGVVVALFTFVSLNINIFSNVRCFSEAIVFSGISFLVLASFVILLLITTRLYNRWWYMFCYLIMFTMIFFLVIWGASNNTFRLPISNVCSTPAETIINSSTKDKGLYKQEEAKVPKKVQAQQK